MSTVWIGNDKTELDAKVEGTDLFSAAANSVTSHYFTFSHSCTFTGIELYAWNSNPGDNITMLIEYYTGAVWLRYKKFGKKFNVYPSVDRVIMFPAEPSQGTRLRIDYDNKGGSSVDFSMNVFKFADSEKINPLLGEQGEDW